VPWGRTHAIKPEDKSKDVCGCVTGRCCEGRKRRRKIKDTHKGEKQGEEKGEEKEEKEERNDIYTNLYRVHFFNAALIQLVALANPVQPPSRAQKG